MSFLRCEKGGLRIRIVSVVVFIELFALLAIQLVSPVVEAQPSITLALSLSSSDLEPGDTLTCTVHFNNTGSGNASLAWINISLPSKMNYLSDNSALEGGVKTGDYNWTFGSLDQRNHSFNILLSLSENALDGEMLNIFADIDYLDDFNNTMPPSSTFAVATARRPVLSVSKTADSFLIRPGEFYNFTISFQNSGSRNTTFVYVNDTLPWPLIYYSDSAGLIGGVMISFMNWSFYDIVGSHSFQITVRALANLTDGLSMVNTVTLYYANVNLVWFPERVATNLTMVAETNMSFSKSVDKSTAYPDNTLHYTLTLANTGTAASKIVWISDTLPAWTNYSSSSPACDSITNNTCSWTLSDVTPGIYEFLLNVTVNGSVPMGSIIQNNASVSFTDSLGTPLGNLTSSANTTIQGNYLELILDDRTISSTPGDIFEFDILMRNEAAKESRAAWLNISLPQGLDYVSDNATDIGGTRKGDYRWEFRNLFPGNHSFRIVTTIDLDVPDGQQIEIDFSLDHTDEYGTGLTRITDRITITISSPVMTAQIVLAKSTYKKGELIEMEVHMTNSGSAPSSDVWVNLTVPSFIAYVNDTASEIGGTRSGDFEYVFNDLNPGNHQFSIFVRYEGHEKDSTNLYLYVFLNYTDSNEDYVGQTDEQASINIHSPSDEFPLLLAVLLAVFVSAMSFAAASNRETVKYKLLILFAPLYSRLRREDVLEHETRGMIRGYIIANPGDHFNSIKDALDLRNGTLAHHLRVLEREKIVKSMKDGKFRRFFPAGMRIKDDAYPTKIETMILEIVEECPGITQKDIASQLGMSQPATSYHINKLKKANMIKTVKHGMSLKHYIVDSSGSSEKPK